MKITITSIKLDKTTVGKLYLDDVFLCYTLENPYRNNAQYISCIPCGQYKIEHYESEKHGSCFIIYGDTVSKKPRDGKKRDGILVHKGNTTKDTSGCILVGMGTGILDGRNAVLHSASAMKKLHDNVSPGINDLEIIRL